MENENKTPQTMMGLSAVALLIGLGFGIAWVAGADRAAEVSIGAVLVGVFGMAAAALTNIFSK